MNVFYPLEILLKTVATKVESMSLQYDTDNAIVSIAGMVVMYRSELWKLNRAEMQMLEIVERKVLRGIYGGKKIDDQWMRRTSSKLNQLYD